MILLLAGCSGTDSVGVTDTEPSAETAQTADTAEGTPLERLREALEDRGLEIREGYAAELDPAACCAWESCYLFNPDNEYLGWWLPPGPGQVAPDPIDDGNGFALAWRLRADEAVVAVGRTPPDAAYFSYRSYLHDHWFDLLGERDWLFYNLGDSLNQFVIGTSDGGPFDAEFVLTTTADATIEAEIRAAALEAGYPAAALNTDVVAGDIELGLHERADTFRMQNRMALFTDEAVGQAYLAAPPVTVWRVSPKVERIRVPLEAGPLRSRGSGTDEMAWSGAVDSLDLAVRATYSDYVAHDLPTVVTASTDDDCAPGCNRDTFFGVSIHYLLPEWADAFVLVYGVNHERTGKSVYSNFTVVGVDHLSGIEAVHSRQMPGSATDYLPGHPQVDDLYVWKIARDCGGDARCIEVPMECPGYGSLGEGSVAFRAYTEASTATGPATSELLIDRAILFMRPAK